MIRQSGDEFPVWTPNGSLFEAARWVRMLGACQQSDGGTEKVRPRMRGGKCLGSSPRLWVGVTPATLEASC